MNEKTLRRKIDAIDFAILETELYLDTHPNDRSAMQMLHEYRTRRKNEISNYEARFGKYIVTAKDVDTSADRWDWINSPWPWERQV